MSQQDFPVAVFPGHPGTKKCKLIKHGRREPPTHNKGLVDQTRCRVVVILNTTEQVAVRALASALAINPN